MAKIQVLPSGEDTPVPFLRGILTRSLQDAGLPFEKAYELASSVRDELDNSGTITTDDLRDKVIARLNKAYGKTMGERYRAAVRAHHPIMIEYEDGQLMPFSRGYYRRCMESIGLPPDEAMMVTAKMYDHLMAKKVTQITAQHVGELTYRCLSQDQDFGPAVARRYLVWIDFLRSGRPLILLIGGTAGCGKSTVATELANRLEIVRTQSTDGLREVMRMMIPERLMPVLHSSSFKAWEALSGSEHTKDKDELLSRGYRSQAELLSVPCEAVIQRALKERVSMILEGVHVHPLLLEKLPKDTDALVVPIMLAVLKPEELRKRIRGRGTHAPQRRSERYLENFGTIWRLQSYLLSEADKSKMPIIPNENKEKVVREVMRTVIFSLSEQFSSDPARVFNNAGCGGTSIGAG